MIIYSLIKKEIVKQIIEKMHMKTIKVSFHHPDYIYKFKIQLNVFENVNMFHIQPASIRAEFTSITKYLILSSEESQMLDSFSLVFQREFTKKYEEILRQRSKVDYLGNSLDEHYNYFIKQMSQDTTLMPIKQLYIYCCLHHGKTELKHLQKMSLLQKIRQFQQHYLTQYQQKTDLTPRQRNNLFLFIDCFIRLLYKIDFHQIPKEQTEGSIIVTNNLNKIILDMIEVLLMFYDKTVVTETFQVCFKIWERSLQHQQQHSWVYLHTQNSNSWLKFMLSILSPKSNPNLIITQFIIQFLSKILSRCINVNDLLLFITESINFKILGSLDEVHQCLKNGMYHSSNSISTVICEEIDEKRSLGVERQVRFREKKYPQNKWNKQMKKVYAAVVELRQKFHEFKVGKIQTKSDRRLSIHGNNQSQRDRIRKQSFIMTSFEQVQRRYQAIKNMQKIRKNSSSPSSSLNKNRCENCQKQFDLSQVAIKFHEQKMQQKGEENVRLQKDNEKLIEINRWHQEQLQEKERMIKELQNTIAQFVDVKKKYMNQHLMRKNQKVLEIKIEPTKPEIKAQEESFITPQKQQVPTLPVLNSPLPPPPPPPPFYSHGFGSSGNSQRGSRGSKEIRKLPSPPPVPLFPSELALPPPPPPPPFTLPTPPPLTLSTPVLPKQEKKRERDIKIVNWTSVQISKVKDSFWEKVEDTDLNEDEIFQFFGKKENPVSKPIFNAQSKKQLKTLLKPDRAKNIQIVIKKTKLPFAQIPFAIADLDQNILTAQNVYSLLSIIPNKQQSDQFIELKIDQPSEWTVADLFFCLITKISGYFEILTAVKFKFQFKVLHEEISSKISAFHNYFMNMRKDQFFQSFLSSMLAIGNYMNTDSNKGNVYGFRFESIEKAYILMTQDNKMSLFEYILQFMERKGVKFPDRTYASTNMIVPIEILREDVREMTKLCGIVQQVLLMSDEDDLRTPDFFLSFYIESREKIQIMDNVFSEAYNCFKDTSDFYCENLKSEKIIAIYNEFKKKVVAYIGLGKGKKLVSQVFSKFLM